MVLSFSHSCRYIQILLLLIANPEYSTHVFVICLTRIQLYHYFIRPYLIAFQFLYPLNIVCWQRLMNWQIEHWSSHRAIYLDWLSFMIETTGLIDWTLVGFMLLDPWRLHWLNWLNRLKGAKKWWLPKLSYEAGN